MTKPEVVAPDVALARFRDQLRRDLAFSAALGLVAALIVSVYLPWQVYTQTAELNALTARRDAVADNLRAKQTDLETAQNTLEEKQRELEALNDQVVQAGADVLAVWAGLANALDWKKGIVKPTRVASAQCRVGTIHSPNGSASPEECTQEMSAAVRFSSGQVPGGPYVYWWPPGVGKIPRCGCLRDDEVAPVEVQTPGMVAPRPEPTLAPAPNPTPTQSAPPPTVRIQVPPGGAALGDRLAAELRARGFNPVVQDTRTPPVVTGIPVSVCRAVDEGVQTAVRDALAVVSVMTVVDGPACPQDVSHDLLVVLPSSSIHTVEIDLCWEDTDAFLARNSRRPVLNAVRDCQFSMTFGSSKNMVNCQVKGLEGPAPVNCELGFWLDPNNRTQEICENDVGLPTRCELDDPKDDDDILPCVWRGNTATCTQLESREPIRQIRFTVLQP